MNEISEKVKAIEALTPTNSQGHRFSTISIGNLNIDSMLSPTNNGRRGSGIPFRSPSIHENNNINPFFSSPPTPLGQKQQIMQGKLFFYMGSKPIKSEDWRASYVSLNGSKLTGVMTTVDESILLFYYIITYLKIQIRLHQPMHHVHVTLIYLIGMYVQHVK